MRQQIEKLWDIVKSPGLMAFLAVAGVLLAVYQTWFYERTPELRGEVLSVGTVFDVRAPLPELDFLYAGRSLKTSNEELRLVSLRVRNSGHTTLTRAEFDDREPLKVVVAKAAYLARPFKKLQTTT